MKTGAILCLVITVAWAAVALVQLWWQPLTNPIFFKLTLSALLLVVVIGVVALVTREYVAGKRQRDQDYLD